LTFSNLGSIFKTHVNAFAAVAMGWLHATIHSNVDGETIGTRQGSRLPNILLLHSRMSRIGRKEFQFHTKGMDPTGATTPEVNILLRD
jgi:hypothetical protein